MNILTFDIEEWFQPLLDVDSDEERWYACPPRIDVYLPKVLDLLDEKGIQSTFFCVGRIARDYPDVVRRIHERGHEVACHTDRHRFVNRMNPETFREDLRNALDSIEQLTGEKVVTFRAPAFSIDERSKWAFEILRENGIETDCSIFPTTRSYGGFPSFGEATPCWIDHEGIRIREFPINTASILGKEVVYCGGGYFRLFPYWLIKRLLLRTDYAITYFHMRDFDSEQPRHLEVLPPMRKFKTYYGLRHSYDKFLRLLNDFTWIGVRQAISMIDWKQARTVCI